MLLNSIFGPIEGSKPNPCENVENVFSSFEDESGSPVWNPGSQEFTIARTGREGELLEGRHSAMIAGASASKRGRKRLPWARVRAGAALD